jgi:ATP-dependent RNA helicase DHX57
VVWHIVVLTHGKMSATTASSTNVNPLTNVPFSAKYHILKEKIDKIPASQPAVGAELGKLLDTNDIILLTGETGSGKSVRVPSLVLQHYGFNARVVCTQPRTVNASSISEFVAQLLDVKLGEEVGYKFKHNDKSSSKTKLLYATDGTITSQQFKNQASEGNKLFDGFDVIIIDEAHERNVQIDFLLLFIKKYLDGIKRGGAGKSKPDSADTIDSTESTDITEDIMEDTVDTAESVDDTTDSIESTDITEDKESQPQPQSQPPSRQKKFIIMSATVELETFRKYFKDHSIGEMSISGRTFPVTQHFAEKSMVEYLPAIKERIIDIVGGKGGNAGKSTNANASAGANAGNKGKIGRGGTGDILVFLPSKREIDELVRDINEKMHAVLSQRVLAVPLYSGLTPEQQALAVSSDGFKKKTIHAFANNGINETAEIKIVVSTEVAETGVTVDGIVYVIESGKVMDSSWDTARRETVLVNAFIPKAAVKQRIGRAGRTQPGIAYHMYTRAEYDGFPDFKQPDIRTTNIDGELMKLLMFKGVSVVGELRKLLSDMIEPPSELQIKSTLRFLAVLNIISSDRDDGVIKHLGECVYSMRMDTQLAMALLSAKNYGVPYDEMLDIITILQTESNVGRWFAKPSMNDKPAMKQFRDFETKYTSMHSDIFSLYRLYRAFQDRKLGSGSRFVRIPLMLEVGRNRRGIADAFHKVGDKCHMEKLGPAAAQMEKNIIQAFMQGYYNQTATLKQIKMVNGRSTHVYQLDAPAAPELGAQMINVEVGRDNTLSKLSKKIIYLGISNINGVRKFNGIINIMETDLLAKVESAYMGGVERVEDRMALIV